MGKLRRGISAEIADTGRPVIHGLGELTGVLFMGCGRYPLEMIILTEKAIEGAGLIENSKVGISNLRPLTVGIIRITGFGSSRTDPIGHTVRGQGIVIPIHQSFPFRPRQMDEPPLPILPQAAKTSLTEPYSTLIHTKSTQDTVLILRNRWWKAICFSTLSMRFIDNRTNFIEVGSDAINAIADSL